MAPGSRDDSFQAEKKAEEVATMRIVFIQNGLGSVKKNLTFWMTQGIIFAICLACNNGVKLSLSKYYNFFSALW